MKTTAAAYVEVPMARPPLIFFILLAAAATIPSRAADAEFLWKTRIRNLLDTQCVKCHGPIEQKSGLVLDNVEDLMKGGDEGPAVIPGKPEESPLWTYLAPDSDPHMPPKKQLDQADMDAIREWIVALGQPKEETAAQKASSPVPEEPSAAIDFFLDNAWREHGVKPAPVADDRTFARRVWLDLAGVIPSRAELEAFLFSADPDKREKLVDRLLASPEYARNMREIWDVLLMKRADGRRFERRAEWHRYLERVFAQNRPWNQVVKEIILARPKTEEQRGAEWFLYEKRNDYQVMAETVAPVIYGTKIDCAQCHDHPLAREIKQAHYWGLVAAFNRSKNREGRQAVVEESAIGGHINFTNLHKESQPAVLTLLGGKTVPEPRPAEGEKEEDGDDNYEIAEDGTRVPKFSRRAALAEAATTDNPLLARAFVNRTWAQFFGRGIVHPVDEIQERNSPAHPELLDWLAADFERHDYDIRRLVRAIVLSEAWQRAAWSGPEAPPAPEMFAAAVERPLTGEALARSMLVALNRPADNRRFIGEVTARFGDIMPLEYIATTQQAMFLTNSPAVAELLNPDPGTTVARLLELTEPEARVREAFLQTLGRLPDDEELSHTVEFLKAKAAAGRSETAVKELLWALLTGPEFSMNR